MPAVTRYVFNQLVAVTIFVTIGLTFAIWLTRSLRLIDYIVNRGLPASTFFSFVALLLPSFLGVVLPIAAFCAALFIYNKLTMDSEMVVLRAAGMSQIQLAKPALYLGIGITGAVYAISLYFLPLSYRAFKELQWELRNDFSTVLLQEGIFNPVSKNITVFVSERNAEGELLDIFVHDNRNPDRPVTMAAERGALVTSETGPRVVMLNGIRQELERVSGRISQLHFGSYTVEIATLQDKLRYRWREPKERFLGELLNPNDSEDDQRFYKELVAEGHQRLIAPLYSFAFVMVAMAALLAGEFNRRGQAARVIVAILCVAAMQGVALALQDLAGRYLAAIPAMYASVAIPIVISFMVLLRRPRRRVAPVPAGSRPA